MLKKILISACLLGMVPFAVSCGDEDRSNYQEPALYPQVKLQLEFIKRDASCTASDVSSIHSDMASYITANAANLNRACKGEDGYVSELNSAKSADNLATEMKNSGYYAGIYIFIAQMLNTLKQCPVDRHDVEKEFREMYKTAGCETLIDDARAFYKTWGAEF